MNRLFINFLPQIFTAITALALVRVYTELLSDEHLGIVMLMMALMSLVDMLILASVNQTVFYYSCKHEYYSFFHEKIQRYLRRIVLLVVLLFIFLHLFIINSLAESDLGVVLVLVTSIIMYLLIELPKNTYLAIMNSLSDRSIYNTQLIFDSFMYFTVIVLYLYIFETWVAIFVAVVTARLVSFIFLQKMILRRVKELQIGDACVKANDFISHAWPISMSGFIGWGAGFMDRFIIASISGYAVTGYYSVVSGLVNRPYGVASSGLSVSFRPELYKSFSKNKYRDAWKVLKKWLSVSFVIGLVGFILFYILEELIIQLLIADSYQNNVEGLMYLLALAFTVNIMTHALENVFLAKGEAKKLVVLQAILLLPFFISIAFGAYFYGVVGAILGKLFSELFKFITLLIYSKGFK